ncbi:hypothetical protein A1A1_17330 [Planococcus antarcticus DSM 14505]|uniref:Uncharacterized protein n=1 Tax=Planococcus antarcticus DSM 14505 TaxID=1185653 RepID=A0AA87II85_9BACL|nr:hypothetical protein [Planococcus antarcticus]EIM05215.1 hypothetical protein A1A1_17330 [Planococcus antarcticus DSM 14505]
MITYNVDETEQAVKFVESNLSFLGKIYSIEHKRLKMESEYQTTINGSEETLVINGGLSSGYLGEGPRGLARVLEKLGIQKEEAEYYAKDRETHKKGFKHTFLVSLD